MSIHDYCCLETRGASNWRNSLKHALAYFDFNHEKLVGQVILVRKGEEILNLNNLSLIN